MCLYYTSNLLSQFIVSGKGEKSEQEDEAEENETGNETSPNLGTVEIDR